MPARLSSTTLCGKESCNLLSPRITLIPGHKSKRNMKTIFLRQFSLSRFLAKTLRINQPAMKNFLENMSFRVDVKLKVSALTYKINTHNMSGVRS